MKIAIITAGITLFGTAFLYLLQKVFENIIWEPIKKQRETIEDIAVALIIHAKFYANPVADHYYPNDNPIKKRILDAVDNTRELASLLKVRGDNIKFYDLWVRLGYIYPRQDINVAYRSLIGLSNAYFVQHEGANNSVLADKIRNSLHIPKQ